MRFLARLILCPFFLFVFTSAGAGSSLATPARKTPPASPAPVAILADKPLSERVVAYEIDAKFDANKHTLDATEVLTYRNLTGQPQNTFPFHLYLNAFQPTSTFMKEVRRDRPDVRVERQVQGFRRGEVAGSGRHGRSDLANQVCRSRRWQCR